MGCKSMKDLRMRYRYGENGTNAYFKKVTSDLCLDYWKQDGQCTQPRTEDQTLKKLKKLKSKKKYR
jgi:hypothetical protein